MVAWPQFSLPWSPTELKTIDTVLLIRGIENHSYCSTDSRLVIYSKVL